MKEAVPQSESRKPSTDNKRFLETHRREVADRPSPLLQIMRKITEETRKEVVQIIRGSKG
jgi:hypothetical protein